MICWLYLHANEVRAELDRMKLNIMLMRKEPSGKSEPLISMDNLKAGFDKITDGLTKTQQALFTVTDALSTELPGLQSMAKGEGNVVQESYNTVPIPEYKPHNLSDLGLKAADPRDWNDWLMVQGSKK